ncbi:hypothetical protein ACROYT_G014535 [Oculina patagonica]
MDQIYRQEAPIRWLASLQLGAGSHMAENAEGEHDIPAIFAGSGDEESFNGFECRGCNNDGDGDVHRDGQEDNSGPTPGFNMADKEEEAQWTDHLSDFQVPAFTAPTGLTFNLPANPNRLHYFVAFKDDNLWDFIVEETNRYA